MIGVYALFAAAVIMMIAAVFIYSRAETNSFDSYLAAVNAVKGDAKKCTDDYAKLKPILDQLALDMTEAKMSRVTLSEEISKALGGVSHDKDAKIKNMNSELELMKVRQYTLEKKIIAKDNNVKVSFSTPLEVEIIRPAKTKGAGQGALLQRAGVPEVAK